MRAELAAREALMARQEARMIKEEKQRELDALNQKLLELQSEPSTAAPDTREAAQIAQSFAMHRNDNPAPSITSRSGQEKAKLEGVKQRFRDRVAAKKRERSAAPINPSPQQVQRSLIRSAGEEMFQHLDFYERSLKAVEDTHDPL